MDRPNRSLLALAAVALCALAAVPCVAVATPGDQSGEFAPTGLDVTGPAADAIGDASSDSTALLRMAEQWQERADRGLPPVQVSGLQSTPAMPTRGQLFGVVVAVVLAAIGVAAWAGRPNVVGRFDRVSRSRRWLPGVDADPAPLDAPADGSLLTDEERIIELLEENGGRLRQQHVVETTDWSKAKVSRLLSSMEDEEAIVRIQLGREKLIFLSGHEPSGARSTLREES